jgi:hypothetical protein
MEFIEMISLIVSLVNYVGPTELINDFIFPIDDPEEAANY